MSNDPRFFAFLKERIGLDVASVGEAIIERAVRQRSQVVGALTPDDYWQRLQRSHDEQQALIEAVIVPETWFFPLSRILRHAGALGLRAIGRDQADARPAYP